jgi:hypothetical protein
MFHFRPTRRPRPGASRGAMMRTIVALLAGLCAPVAAGQCEGAFIPSPYPKLPNPSALLGYGGGSTYSVNDQFIPEPVPMGIKVEDTDSFRVRCDQRCKPLQFATSGLRINWSRAATGGGAPGDFVDALGSLVATIDDAPNILYAPPSDLLNGQSRTITVSATIDDGVAAGCDCPRLGTSDPSLVENFTVTVQRNGAGKYSVTAAFVLTAPTNIAQPPCNDPGPPCNYLPFPPTVSAETPPVAKIVSYPMNDMLVGETRMIRGKGEDVDKYTFECGGGPISNVITTLFCDRVTYQWTVTAGPGSGTFVAQGRSALFYATTPGSVTVELKVLAPGGGDAPATESKTFLIASPVVRGLEFRNCQQIYRDGTGSDYSGAQHWQDANFDGDALDVGDRRFPVAYKAGDFVTLQQIVVQSNSACVVPPVAVLKGTGPAMEEYVVGVARDATGGLEFRWIDSGNTDAFRASTALAAGIKRHQAFQITWEAAFRKDLYVPSGSTDVRLYVTLVDPVPCPDAGMRNYESVYDISCSAADGETSGSDAVKRIAARFAGLNVSRKAVDGDNGADGTQMTYWVGGSPPTNMGAMLLNSTGDGQCSAWAELFVACCYLQGENGAKLAKVENKHGPGTLHFLVKDWLNLTSNPVLTTGLDLNTQVSDQPGIAAQGNLNPPSYFMNHYVVTYPGKIYDPSYGTDFDSEQLHQDGSLFGFEHPAVTVVSIHVAGVDNLNYN